MAWRPEPIVVRLMLHTGLTWWDGQNQAVCWFVGMDWWSLIQQSYGIMIRDYSVSIRLISISLLRHEHRDGNGFLLKSGLGMRKQSPRCKNFSGCGWGMKPNIRKLVD